MVYEAVFGELEASVLNLRDAVMGLSLAADGAPERHTLSDLVADASVDLQSQANVMVSAVAGVRSMPMTVDRSDAIVRAVTVCQEQYVDAAGVLQNNLLHYERVAELATLCRKKGGAWTRWTREVLETLDGCRQPLYDVQKALVHCWKMISAAVPAGRAVAVERGDPLNALGN